MPRTAFLSMLMIAPALLLVAEPSFAVGKKKTGGKADPAVGTVEKVLRAEVAGQIDRRGQLVSTLEQNPDSGAARWQSGFVRDGNHWRSFDEALPSTAASELLDEYRARRQEAAQNSSGQLELANWCKKHGLTDQNRAHLSASLALSPTRNDPVILQRLGYQRIGTQWRVPVRPEQPN